MNYLVLTKSSVKPTLFSFGIGLTLTSFSSDLLNQFNELGFGCIFKNLLGVPCPFCGTTRGVIALSEFRFTDSILLNPYSLAFVGLVGFSFYSILQGKTYSELTLRLNDVLRTKLAYSIYAICTFKWLLDLNTQFLLFQFN